VMFADSIAERPREACPLNRNPLHLVEAHLVAPAIVELRRAGRGLVRHGGGFRASRRSSGTP
jgi:hypothetical protein